MKRLFDNVFDSLPVLVTGHTGFKGSWLSLWLTELGANVAGYSLQDPPTQPSNFELMQLGRRIVDIRADIRDLERLKQVISTHQPRVIFHLAAQPIVLHSYEQPKLTFDTNTIGTVNILEAIRTANSTRATESVRALVSITTDKVYQDEEWLWGYRENDRLGGYDPYSASKAMAEYAIASYRHSYFPASRYDQHGTAIASVRAGNVIGGGDFADYRLVPDCMRALMATEPILIRNPFSIRPWQHVLEPLSGYIWLAARLLQDGPAFAEAWNFGPLEQTGVTTQALAEKLIQLWGSGSWKATDPNPEKETGYLRLSWEKAAARLGWRPVYMVDEALAEITAWFKAYQQKSDMFDVGRQHIEAYVKKATGLGLPWTVDR